MVIETKKTFVPNVCIEIPLYMPHNKIAEGLQKELNNCSWKRKLLLDHLLVFITEERGRGNQRDLLDSGYDPPQVNQWSLGDCEGPRESIQAFLCGLCTLSLMPVFSLSWNIWEPCFEVECWNLGILSKNVSCLLDRPYRIFALIVVRW